MLLKTKSASATISAGLRHGYYLSRQGCATATISEGLRCGYYLGRVALRLLSRHGVASRLYLGRATLRLTISALYMCTTGAHTPRVPRGPRREGTDAIKCMYSLDYRLVDLLLM